MKCISSAELLLQNPDDTRKTRKVEFEELMRELSSVPELHIRYEDFKKVLKDHRTMCSFLVTHNDQLKGVAIAVCIITCLGDVALIRDVVVTESLRGKGYGRKLIEHLEEQGINSAYNIRKWELVTRPERKLDGFYRALGFKKVSVDRFVK